MTRSNTAKQIRYDVEGRCSCGKCGAGKRAPTLSLPRKVSLRELAEMVYVHRTVDTLTREQRDAMSAEVLRIDGETLPPGKSDLFLAGVYLGALSRAPQSATKPTTPKKSAEAEAREKLRRDSASAWRKK